jgi:hypothetical protein
MEGIILPILQRVTQIVGNNLSIGIFKVLQRLHNTEIDSPPSIDEYL